MNNQLKKQEELFTIVAKGKSETEAMEHIFQQVKREAYNHCKGYLIEMHVHSFEVVAIEERVETTKFLYFFLPKERKRIELTARVKVTIDYIERGLKAG